MRRTMLLAASMIAYTFASAQALTLADAKGKNAVQLGAEELKQLLPGAKVVTRTAAGSTRNWENRAEGTFVASSDGRGATGGGRGSPGTGMGTWRIADNGTYCVKIQWNMSPEDWCRYIFKVGEKYYTFATLDDTARSWEFELSR